MTTHFPIVPVDAVPLKALSPSQQGLRPLALLVDDEPIITDTLAAILNANGIAALSAYCPIDALESALLMPPNILITDLSMPGMDGLELAVQVTRAAPDCEVILFSGHISMCDIGARMHAIDCDFMTLIKPVHPADMLKCVCARLALHGWSLTPAEDGRRSNDDSASAGYSGNGSRGVSSNVSVRTRWRSCATHP